jgi:hypothetical protein
MRHSSFLMKNLAAIFSIAVVSFFSATIISAQCEGVYFKPTGKTPTDSLVEISGLQKDIAGDFNGDGKLDLVAIENSGSNTYNKLFIYPGDGAGKFGARTEINLPQSLDWYYDSFFIRDFNGDGKLDLIVLTVSNTLVYLNNGTGVFAPPVVTPGAAQIVNVLDVNNDSLMDLITGSGTNVSYRLGNANGTFGSPVSLPQAGYIGRLGGDFDGDGDKDFGVLDFSGPAPVFKVVYNQGGSFVAGNQSVALDGGGNIFPEDVKDLNNDGKPDVILTIYSNTPKVTILLNQGNGNFAKTDYVLSQSPVISFTELSDFNGDGFIDLFNRIHTQPGTYPSGYIISLNNGAGAFTQRTYPFGGFDTYDDRPVGDVNNDGKTDFLRVNNARGNYITLFKTTQFTVKMNVCSNFGQPKIVDFDRDRRTDPTVWRPSDGRWRFQINGTFSTNGTISSFNWGAPDDKIVPGDYDGDGGSDAAVFRNGVWYVRNSSNNSAIAVTFGAGADKPVPADFDGDSRTDFAVYRPSNGTWYILMNATNQFYAAQFGTAEDIPVAEDYDGDGKTDIAVFRPSQGFWYVLRSTNNTVHGVQWGLGTDEPHPADYDGDGKADFCVRRRSNGYWYILRSFNNQSGAIPFGTSEDIAQIGDWDGNSVMDIAVYRPSTRRWYATSPGGAFLPAFGEANETPVASVQR